MSKNKSTENSQIYNVKGMHCASCAMTIEKSLKKVDGVIECNVNYANEKVKLVLDTEKVGLSDLNKKIEGFGYEILSDSKGDTNDKHGVEVTPDENNLNHVHHSGISDNTIDKSISRFKYEITLGFVFTVVAVFVMGWDIATSFNLTVEMPAILKGFFHHLLPLFATYTLFVLGKNYIKAVLVFFKTGSANMDTLVGLGTLAAFIYSFVVSAFENYLNAYLNVEHNYYDVVVVVVTLITYGKYLESKSKLKTGDAIKKLLNLQAKTAFVEHDDKIIEIPISELKINDVIIVKPGSKIAVDGKVIEGFSSVDESMVTGESIFVDKKIGDNVIGGTINKQSVLKVKALKIGSETLLAQIVKMVEEAQGSKAPVQKIADKISGVFVPIVIVVAILSLISWLVIGLNYLTIDETITKALTAFIGVLVIACPCALGLATPTAIIVGTGKGAENGILIKDAESLETLSKVTAIVFDKTGTITNGNPVVTDIVRTSDLSEKEILEILASIEKYSEHPLSIAILKKAEEENISIKNVEDFEILEGLGLTAKLNGKKYFAGNFKLIEKLNLTVDHITIDKFTTEGKTPVILAAENNLIAIIGIADTLKSNSVDAIKNLHSLGLKLVLLSGDHTNTANYIAKQAGIDTVIANVLPQEKALYIRELKSKNEIVAMVGDGVNDAIALSESDVGIAMGTGTDVAIESAQITLLKGDISKLYKAVKLSKKTLNIIKQNLFWAFIYNLVGIPLAAGLLYPIWGITLNPVFAGLAMAFSSVSVVFNALRFKYKTL